MRISRALLDEVVAHARESRPEECCGMIAARDGVAVAVHRAANAAETPRVHYEMDPRDQIRIHNAIEGEGLELGAVYHSHPETPPIPSKTDVRLAFWPDSIYIIVGFPEGELDVRAWRIEKDVGFTPADLVVE